MRMKDLNLEIKATAIKAIAAGAVRKMNKVTIKKDRNLTNTLYWN